MKEPTRTPHAGRPFCDDDAAIARALAASPGSAACEYLPHARFAAADLTLVTLPDDHGNCYEDNSIAATFFSLIELFSGNPPPWSPPSCP